MACQDVAEVNVIFMLGGAGASSTLLPVKDIFHLIRLHIKVIVFSRVWFKAGTCRLGLKLTIIVIIN